MTPLSTTRLSSLDVFRGLAIAGMILVNTPGSWSHVYPPLLHASWHGFTPTDLVFPAFLFIAGVAMAFSWRQYLPPFTHGAPPQTQWRWLYGRLGRRCLLLFGLGLCLNGLGLVLKTWPEVDWSTLRWLGVLQRISVAYFGAAVLVLHSTRRWLIAIAVGILLGYWALLTIVPVPGFGVGDLSLENNVVGYIDRVFLGASHLYTPTFDPEGLTSTLPAIVTVLLGYFTGEQLRDRDRASRHSLMLLSWGLSGVIAGSLWGFIFPINKQLWTSSYVLYSAGWSLLILALCYELIEIRKIQKWSWPAQIMGRNAIVIFVASGILVRLLNRLRIGSGEKPPSAYTWLYQTLFASWAGPWPGSLFFAIANVLFWCGVAAIMYRQRWFIKL